MEGTQQKKLPPGIEDKDRDIVEPYLYIRDLPGKGVRELLINAINAWLKIDPEKMKIIVEAVDMLHNASLLVDDIEDGSKLRRGVPVAHDVYGIPSTLNCANYIYFIAMNHLKQLNEPETWNVFLEELLNLHRGQGMDIFWRDNHVCPTEEEYKQMVSDKTGGLFRLAVRLMQIFSENKSDFRTLIYHLGLYFQIRDDYINLSDEEYMKSKSFCEDLTEGKYSFPIIHSILATPKDRKLSKILAQRTEDNEMKRFALEIMKNTDSFEYTKSVLVTFKQDTEKDIELLGGNKILTQILEKLTIP